MKEARDDQVDTEYASNSKLSAEELEFERQLCYEFNISKAQTAGQVRILRMGVFIYYSKVIVVGKGNELTHMIRWL